VISAVISASYSAYYFPSAGSATSGLQRIHTGKIPLVIPLVNKGPEFGQKILGKFFLECIFWISTRERGTPYFEDSLKDNVSLRGGNRRSISLVEEFWKKMVKKI
jgi:hypothetical protein